MKPKELLDFCMRNAEEIRSIKDSDTAWDMMLSIDLCVLRPSLLPRSIRRFLTFEEYNEYYNNAHRFSSVYDINRALEWVEQWIQKG